MSKECQINNPENAAFINEYKRVAGGIYRITRLFMSEEDTKAWTEDLAREMLQFGKENDPDSWHKRTRRRLLNGASDCNLGDRLCESRIMKREEGSVMEDESCSELADKLSEVKGEEAEVLMWRFIAGLEINETASVMGLEDAQVLNRQSVGLEKLQKLGLGSVE